MYTHMITFRFNDGALWQKTFQTAKEIPTIEEWNEFITSEKLKSKNFVVINILTMKS